MGGKSVVGGGVGGGLNMPPIRLGGTKLGPNAGGMFILPRLARGWAPNSDCVGLGEGTRKGDGDDGVGGANVERLAFRFPLGRGSTGSRAWASAKCD
jgi:hypothetical protein